MGEGVTLRRIEPATRDDLLRVTALLSQADLPADVAEHFPAAFVVARDGPAISGCAGLERYDRAALLRSVAVAPTARGSGLGAALVEERVGAARAVGAEAVYVLTTSAAGFFRRHGFVDASRADAAPALRASSQFDGCCATAACLVRRL